MAHNDNTRFARMALNLGMTDVAKFNEAMELWERDPTKDTGMLLLNHGLVSQDQYDQISSMFDAKKDVLKNFDVSATGAFISPEKINEIPRNADDYTENFTLRGVLGQGGIGRVFIAFDKNIHREVAIKELVAEKESAKKDRNLARFIREARITGQLEHPGIIPVYELNRKTDGNYFYVMKYVHGKTLYEEIFSTQRDDLEESYAARIRLLDRLIDACEAVGYAHSKGIIHRDLKPSNIIVGEFGETIILDWGLARPLSEDEVSSRRVPAEVSIDSGADSMVTLHGELLGTPSYMPPEQIDPKYGRVDAQSDVYSLGVILYMILTGEKPYSGRAKEVMKEITGDHTPPSPRSYGDFVSPELSAICEKAVSKDKKSRFRNASELADELKAFRDGRLVSVYPYSRKELFRRFVKKNKLPIISAIIIMAAIVAGGIVSVHFAIDSHRSHLAAERALSDVTALAESALKLSEDAAIALNKHFKVIGEKVKTLDLASEIPSTLSFDPIKSPYQVWCMDPAGNIVYDEDPNQTGKNLFTNAMFIKFPELEAIGRRIRDEAYGVGHYKFMARGGGAPIYKVAAWDSFKVGDVVMKIIVSYPYTQ